MTGLGIKTAGNATPDDIIAVDGTGGPCLLESLGALLQSLSVRGGQRLVEVVGLGGQLFIAYRSEDLDSARFG